MAVVTASVTLTIIYEAENIDSVNPKCKQSKTSGTLN